MKLNYLTRAYTLAQVWKVICELPTTLKNFGGNIATKRAAALLWDSFQMAVQTAKVLDMVPLCEGKYFLYANDKYLESEDSDKEAALVKCEGFKIEDKTSVHFSVVWASVEEGKAISGLHIKDTTKIDFDEYYLNNRPSYGPQWREVVVDPAEVASHMGDAFVGSELSRIVSGTAEPEKKSKKKGADNG